MTAEVAILNKSGIVLASDSASTIGGNKVYNTAKKLFTLDPTHSLGVMVYGNAEFMGVPWEIIIAQFRRFIGKEILENLDDYCDSFLKFLETRDYLKTENLQGNYIHTYIHNVIMAVFMNSEESVNKLMANDQKIEMTDFKNILLTEIQKIEESFATSNVILEIDEELFYKQYSEIIKDHLHEISTYSEVSEALLEPIINLIFYTIVRDNTFLSSTGIVIAGYGKSEIFPSLKSFHLYGFIMNKLKYSVYQDVVVGTNHNDIQATIIPFAQDDVINTVVQGIDPQLSEFLASMIHYFDGESRNTYKAVLEELSAIQQKHYIEPLLNMIGLLPVDETSVIAETLLNLTSFKRKYTTSVETVGGPIDVLSITPGEGPIWIKRKHYFDISDNLGYTIRRGPDAKYN